MDTITRPEKRKNDDNEYEGPSKRLNLENDFIEVPKTTAEDEEYEPTSFTEEQPDSQEIKQEIKHEIEQEEEEEEYEPTAFVKEEPEPSRSVLENNTTIETIVPFDRLVVLHLEATCDENPTNPAAVQVTKENSEIIGKERDRK
jgi:hypothetical protein